MAHLGRLTIARKTGEEPFRDGKRELGFDLLSFWRWSASDLVSNATRGVVAEYIVARALGLGADSVRDEWGAYDLHTPSGVKIEVKSAAFVQSWHQDKLSAISFRTPMTRPWNADTGRQSSDCKRQADVYVFALLAHREKSTIDPLNVDQWEFFVVPTRVLDERTRSQHSITLPTLQRMAISVRYADLPVAVEDAARRKAV
ncbi:MAG: hypothetical protein ACYSWU_05075 [Planctomycetota bacterium]|jgi:hypothetical protein